MIRTPKAIVAGAALAAAGGLVAADAAYAQWGYAPAATYSHAPYAGSSFAYGYNNGSPNSLYGPSYSQAFGYQTAYPAYGPSSFYDPGAVAYGYNTSAVPTMAPRHRRTSIFGVYRPYGDPEVTYKYRRDGSMTIDVDD